MRGAERWRKAGIARFPEDQEYRGTPRAAGVHDVVDRGGQCEGVALRLADDDLAGRSTSCFTGS